MTAREKHGPAFSSRTQPNRLCSTSSRCMGPDKVNPSICSCRVWGGVSALQPPGFSGTGRREQASQPGRCAGKGTHLYPLPKRKPLFLCVLMPHQALLMLGSWDGVRKQALVKQHYSTAISSGASPTLPQALVLGKTPTAPNLRHCSQSNYSVNSQ